VNNQSFQPYGALAGASAGSSMARSQRLEEIMAERIFQQKQEEIAAEQAFRQQQLGEQSELKRLYQSGLDEDRKYRREQTDKVNADRETDRQTDNARQEVAMLRRGQIVSGSDYARLKKYNQATGFNEHGADEHGSEAHYEFGGSAAQQEQEADRLSREKHDTEQREWQETQNNLTRANTAAIANMHQNGMNANQQFTATERLAGDWTKATSPIKSIKQQQSRMDVGLRALDRGDRNAASQTLIITFNKLLDDISVVREGEYIRTEHGASVANRINGALQALQTGGSKLPDSELRKLAQAAKEMGNEAIGALDIGSTRKKISSRAKRWGLHDEDVFGDDQYGLDPAPAAAPAINNILGGGASNDPLGIRGNRR
jgi:hypothetical protein